MAKNISTYDKIEPISGPIPDDFKLDAYRKCDITLIALVKRLLVDTESLQAEVAGLKSEVAELKVVNSSLKVENDELKVVCDDLKVGGDQLKVDGDELKLVCKELKGEIETLHVDDNTLNDKINCNSVGLGKVEQYSRRGTLTVVGVKMTPGEDVFSVVKSLLSTDDVKLVDGDFEAIHRNGDKDTKFVRQSDNKEFTNPPSITVRFSNLTKKDKVLRGYKNFHPNRKPKQVRVYQSMTPYYKLLKNNITDYFKRLQVKVKWVHWRSSTAGMCVKLDNGKLLSKLFCFADVEAAYLPSNGTR